MPGIPLWVRIATIVVQTSGAAMKRRAMIHCSAVPIAWPPLRTHKKIIPVIGYLSGRSPDTEAA